jgi:glycosyltransferase involved in cell wall biosynthesis
VKVLFLNPIGELGGAERSLLDLIRALKQASDSLELILAVLAPGPLLDAARRLGCEVRLIPLPPGLAELGDSALRESGGRTAFLSKLLIGLVQSPGLLVRLRREIASLAPDFLHTNGFKAHLLGAITRPRGTRLVWHLRDFLGNRPILRRALPALARRAELAIAISEAVASDVRSFLSIPVVTVLNGIDTDYFAPGAVEPMDLDSVGRLPPANSSILRVGLIATYARWKGHEVFLQAAARLKEQPIRFFVVGGPLYETLRSQWTVDELSGLVAQLGLMKTTALIPFQRDPRAAYLAFDVVVHASTAPEPFGRTIAEAMSSGRPVIASALGGAREQIEDGRTGLLVPPNDPDALAGSILALHQSAGWRARLGAAARAAAVAKLDSKRLGPAVLACYQQVQQLRSLGLTRRRVGRA